jgi:hypothetical protein
MSPSGSKDADCHFVASFFAAVVNFPLWRAAAIGQSGFKVEGSNFVVRYAKAVLQPPHRGVMATMLGMTWARGFIFFGSDVGKDWLLKTGVPSSVATGLPPAVLGTFVQIANMPIVRATITIQNPASTITTVRASLVNIYTKSGVSGLWHGTSAGILKTVPKYMTAVAVRDYFERTLPPAPEGDRDARLQRAAVKSVAAGVAGAALTNPLDVIRNEMFKTEQSLTTVCKDLYKAEGFNFAFRGMQSNVIAVAIPIAVTIFMTDVLKGMKDSRKDDRA